MAREEISSFFTKPKISLQCSQNPPLVPICSHTNAVKTLPNYLFKLHFNIIFPFKPWSWKWTLTVKFSEHAGKSLLSHACVPHGPSIPRSLIYPS